MYTGSSQAWKKYEEYLQDMIKELENPYTPLDNKQQEKLFPHIMDQVKKVDDQVRIAKTAANVYSNTLATLLPKKEAPQTAQAQSMININGKNYLKEDFSDEAIAYFNSYKAALNRVKQLDRKLKIFKTAQMQ